MRKLKIILIAFLAATSFTSCSEEDDFSFIAKEDPDGISFLNAPLESYVLSSANSDALAERFVWNAVNVDVPTTVRYELQGSTTQSFEDLVLIGEDIAETNYAVTVGKMIELAEEAGLDIDPETEEPNTGTIYFRVRAFAGTNSENNVEQFSEPIAVNVELKEAEEEEVILMPHLYLVGDATAAGWDPKNNNTPFFRDPANENLFYFTGRFAGGEGVEGFKLLEINDWQPQWGLSEGSLTNSTLLGGDPAAFPVAADAFYSLVVNTEEMTYTFEEFDASAAATYPTIGVVGDATPGGWDVDTDMTQSAFNPHIWYLEGVELGDGFIKFRANDAWDISWGSTTSISGQGTLGGPDIPATDGTYNIWFNDITGRYILIPQL